MSSIRPTSPDVFWNEDVHLEEDVSQELLRPSHQAEMEAEKDEPMVTPLSTSGEDSGPARGMSSMIACPLAPKKMRPHESLYIELDEQGRPIRSGVQTSLDRWVVSVKQPKLVGYTLDKKLRERCPEEHRADFDAVCTEWWDRAPTAAERKKFYLTPDWSQLKSKMAIEARAASRGSRSRLVEAKLRMDCRCVASLPLEASKSHLSSMCGCLLQMHKRVASLIQAWNDDGAKALGVPYGGSSSLAMGKVQQVEDDNTIVDI